MKTLTYLLSILLATGCAVARVQGRVASDPIVDASSLRFPEQARHTTGVSDEQRVVAIRQALAGRLALLDRKCGEAKELFEQATATAVNESADGFWTEYRKSCADGAEPAHASAPSASLAALPVSRR